MNKYLQVIKTCLKDKIMISGGRADRFECLVFNAFAIVLRGLLYLAQHALALVGISAGVSQIVIMIFVSLHFVLFLSQYTSIIRRLHDTNRSGAHLAPIFIGLLLSVVAIFAMIPMLLKAAEVLIVVSAIYVVVLCCLKGTPGDNKYGSPVNSQA